MAKKPRSGVTAGTQEFAGFTDTEKRGAAAVIEITTGIGRRYGLRIEPGKRGSKPILLAVHL